MGIQKTTSGRGDARLCVQSLEELEMVSGTTWKLFTKQCTRAYNGKERGANQDSNQININAEQKHRKPS